MPGRREQSRNRPTDLDGLPPLNTSRWVARRKAQVASAVQNGLLSVEDACRLYKLTIEELTSWQRALCMFGVRGLQATRRSMDRMAYHGATAARGARSTHWAGWNA